MLYKHYESLVKNTRVGSFCCSHSIKIIQAEYSYEKMKKNNKKNFFYQAFKKG
jgi:hypothetical protein